jgi:hypothetical protein
MATAISWVFRRFVETTIVVPLHWDRKKLLSQVLYGKGRNYGGWDRRESGKKLLSQFFYAGLG